MLPQAALNAGLEHLEADPALIVEAFDHYLSLSDTTIEPDDFNANLQGGSYAQTAGRRPVITREVLPRGTAISVSSDELASRLMSGPISVHDRDAELSRRFT